MYATFLKNHNISKSGKQKRVIQLNHPEINRPYTRSGFKVGRNELCLCGSGLKSKKCCNN